MAAITRDSLLTLEAYARERSAFRARVLAHKRDRAVALGDHVTLLFEDELTIRYQIQEMLRVEKMFEASGIQEELDAYNPLVPDGSNLKATMLLEYEDADGLRVDGFPAVRAIADEDLDRENAQKTSAVHFVRFELTPEMIEAFKSGRDVAMGIDHPNYRAEVTQLPDAVRSSLQADFA